MVMTKCQAFPLVVVLGIGAANLWAARPQDAAPQASDAAQAPASASAAAQKPPAENENDSGRKTPEGPADSNSKAASKSKVGTSAAGGNAGRHKAAASDPEGGPRKVVVRHGGASEPAAQIAPGMSLEEAGRQRQNTERLLGATGDQLQLLSSRPLDEKRQGTVAQIRNFMNGARAALQEGDLRRANTLAEKAHLLSDDLLQH